MSEVIPARSITLDRVRKGLFTFALAELPSEEQGGHFVVASTTQSGASSAGIVASPIDHTSGI